MRKVIFLDVDGVLNSELNEKINNNLGRWSSRDIIMYEESMMSLYEIISATGAEIVLSSTWRYPDEDGSYISKENLIKQLSEYGMNLSDETPQLAVYDRALEILTYLENHPEVTHYIVIDDDIELLKNDIIKPHLVYTYYQIGLTEQDIFKAITILEH